MNLKIQKSTTQKYSRKFTQPVSKESKSKEFDKRVLYALFKNQFTSKEEENGKKTARFSTKNSFNKYDRVLEKNASVMNKPQKASTNDAFDNFLRTDVALIDGSTVANTEMRDTCNATDLSSPLKTFRSRNVTHRANSIFDDIIQVVQNHPPQQRNQTVSPSREKKAAGEEQKNIEMIPGKDAEHTKMIKKEPTEIERTNLLSFLKVDRKSKDWVSVKHLQIKAMKKMRENLSDHFILKAEGKQNVKICEEVFQGLQNWSQVISIETGNTMEGKKCFIEICFRRNGQFAAAF